MKLLIYSHYFAPSIGGVETIVMSIARGLAESRAENGVQAFEVTLVTQTPRENFDDSELPFSVIRQPSLWRLTRLLRGADAVHIAGPALEPLVLGLAMRKPVVIEHHGFQVICPTGQLFMESRGEPCPGHFMAGHHSECWHCDLATGWFGARKLWLLTFVRRFLSKRVAANIMPTNWLGMQLNLPRATTIYHGLVQIAPAQKNEERESRVPVIVFQGRLVTTKGARVLLEAAKLLCEQKLELSLVIIGDGPDRERLEHLANQPPLLGRVQFAGKLAPAALEAKLQEATVVVAPSLGGEVFGLVVAENMKRGLPVVASDLGSFQEVLGPSGKTFRLADASALASELARVLENPVDAARIAEAAQNRARDCFSLAKMIDEHAVLYRRIERRA